MSTPILVAMLGALIIVLFVFRGKQGGNRRSSRRGKGRAGQRPQSRRQPVAPYVSASLRGVTQEPAKPRRTSGLT